MWRFGSGVYISCTVFVSFSSGHSEIAASLATRVQPSHSFLRSHYRWYTNQVHKIVGITVLRVEDDVCRFGQIRTVAGLKGIIALKAELGSL